MPNKIIKSMTAFARTSGQGEWGNAVWEIRSVNHRYLEQFIRLPDSLREIELDVRQLSSKYLQRGKLDCQLRFEVGALNNDVKLNHELLKSLNNASEEVAGIVPRVVPYCVIDLLKWPGVVIAQSIDISKIKSSILNLYEEALQNLVTVRQREGEALKQHILSRLEKMQEIVSELNEKQDQIRQAQRDNLLQRLNEIKVNYDEQRFEQEMVYLAQKSDVTEELDRLQTHINEVLRITEGGGVVGRRLDFFMQELNREANTLGAKSVNADVTQLVVEIKVLIEQMREQVQNIE